MDTVIRVAFVYVFLFVALRLMGKREFGQLAPFDLLVLLLIPELFQQAMIGNDVSMTTAVIGACALMALVLLTSMVSYRSERARSILESSPTVLVQDGRLIEENLHLERVAPDEILEAARHAGLDLIGAVRWAILESSGKISIVPRAARRRKRKQP